MIKVFIDLRVTCTGEETRAPFNKTFILDVKKWAVSFACAHKTKLNKKLKNKFSNRRLKLLKMFIGFVCCVHKKCLIARNDPDL